ncbi:MAG TPA: hypothetical protein VGX78_16410 [Pirellulales bacterium]|jgi:hypothetical protein|nr:hypothetical protein [Pirellulales bacterium]
MKSPALVACMLLVGAAAHANPVDTAALRRQQEALERARATARELAAEVLDVQLRRLRENGLDSLPLFGAVSQMRAHLEGLVDVELRDVVEMLRAAQRAAPDQREQALAEARRRVLQAVVSLATGRPGLERRLKTAEIAVRIRRLIERESLVLDLTRSRVAGPPRDAGVLVRDQRDVLASFDELVDLLSAARSWGGAIAASAAEGSGALALAQVEQALENSLRSLEGQQWQAAGESQGIVVEALEQLLKKVEAAQALIVADRETMLERVLELAGRQAQLCAETAGAELTDASADALVKRQTRIERELADLTLPMRHTPSAVESLERAHAAAFAASGRLFELAATEALADQQSVLANLAQVEQRLDELDRSAAEPAPPADERSPRDTSPQPASSGRETASPPSEGHANAAHGETPATARTGRGISRRDFSNEAWFATLPAEVRRAIRAQANRPFPRGYEERLRRYFEGPEQPDAAARDSRYPGSVTAPEQGN